MMILQGLAPMLFTGAVAAYALAACHAPTSQRSSLSATEPVTLRRLYALEPPARLVASRTAVVFVDFQDEFFHGRLPVEGGAAAVRRAAELRGWARDRGVLVVHVRNVVSRPGTPIFASGSPTVAFVPELEPAQGELVVTKGQAGAFSRTDLDELLRARHIDTLIVAGIMTHLAVDTTARDGAVLGYRVVVAADACATRALPSPLDGGQIDAAELHRVALASLADRFADVLRVEEILRIAVTHA